MKSTWLEVWNNYLKIKVGTYYGWSTLPNTGLIPLDTILYERSNIYRCIISYTKGASFQADFTNNWMLVSEGKQFNSVIATSTLSLDLSSANVFNITQGVNISSFGFTNGLNGHSYIFKFNRISGSTAGYTIGGISSSLFKASYGI